MATYMIVTIKNVKDRHLMEQYWANVTPTFADTGVKSLSVYTPFKIVEGEGPIDGMILAEFPDMETANRGTRVQPIKQSSTTGRTGPSRESYSWTVAEASHRTTGCLIRKAA